MSKGITANILMVRPANFSHNAQTASTNLFQVNEPIGDPDFIRDRALEEFEGFVQTLKNKGVNVLVAYDTPEPPKPDSLFPNNWATYHHDGTVVLYPMYSPNRRWERRRSILQLIAQEFVIENEIDLSHYEEEGKFLEGTGSMVFDHEQRICYACLSARTHEEVLHKFCEVRGYELVRFESTDDRGQPIYHTNVMFSLCQHYAVVCLASIRLKQERDAIVERLESAGKEVVDISMDQMYQFCGNVLEIGNQAGKSLLAMSERAFLSFRPDQLEIICRYSEPVYASLNTIERLSGGGARCMMAEIFLPKK